MQLNTMKKNKKRENDIKKIIVLKIEYDFPYLLISLKKFWYS